MFSAAAWVFWELRGMLGSLWETPAEGAPHANEAGVFHGLFAGLCYWVFVAYARLIEVLCRAGLDGLANVLPWLVPGIVRRAGAREYQRRHP